MKAKSVINVSWRSPLITLRKTSEFGLLDVSSASSTFPTIWDLVSGFLFQKKFLLLWFPMCSWSIMQNTFSHFSWTPQAGVSQELSEGFSFQLSHYWNKEVLRQRFSFLIFIMTRTFTIRNNFHKCTMQCWQL
jgi:hypothetical protein